jgi:Domain of unknown function (DUF397)
MDHITSTRWRTSSYSGGNGGECVQVAAAPSAGRILVRDSKDPEGPVLTLTPNEWRRFTGHIKR